MKLFGNLPAPTGVRAVSQVGQTRYLACGIPKFQNRQIGSKRQEVNGTQIPLSGGPQMVPDGVLPRQTACTRAGALLKIVHI